MDRIKGNEIFDPSELIVQGQFDKALAVLDECIKNDKNNYEWYYMMALCFENLNQIEDAYFYYRFALFLGRGSADVKILKNGFDNLCSYADANEYRLGKSCQKFMTDRLKLKEYAKSHEFLTEVLYDQNPQAGRVVLTEENMLIFMMLEIVLCEKNSMPESDFINKNTCIKFNNDVYEFRNAYREIKLMARRIWFGMDIESQKKINEVIDKYYISGDMLAVIVKYSVESNVWQDAFARLNAATQYEHPAIAQVILRYFEWLKKSDIGGQDKCGEPAEYDNHADVVSLDCKDATVCLSKQKREECKDDKEDCEKNSKECEQKDKNKISIIFCTNDELYSSECVKYLKRLIIPDGMKLEIIEVWNASGMASGYNTAMDYSDAAYKVYIHHDTFIINRNMLIDLMNCFNSEYNPHLIGIVGSTCLKYDGCWWKENKENLRMSLYQDAVLNILNSQSIKTEGILENADAIDGIFIATSEDVRWREDLFDNWHFYDISQCYEFRQHGLKTVIYNSGQNLVLHETTMKKDPHNLYEKYRQVFVKEYMKS